MGHCEHCPLADPTARCPSLDYSSYCKHLANERDQPHGYWKRKLLAEIPAQPKPVEPVAKARPALPGQVRVGLLCPVLTQAGAERWQLTLARLVDRQKVSWRGCAVMSDTTDPTMLDKLREVMPVWVGRDQEAARALIRDSDVIVHWCINELAEILDGLDHPPAMVQALHSPSQCAYSRKHYAKTLGTDYWVAVSEHAMEAVPESVRANTRTIGNCIDPERLVRSRSREQMHGLWGVPGGSLVAGFYGRIAPEKGLERVIRMARSLPPIWHTVIVGPDYMPGLDHAPDLPNLHWAGSDPAAGDVLRAFDVLLVPSDYESFGLTIAEGVEVGTPVVATPVGIATLHPGIARIVDFDATGPEIASQVEAAVWEGRPPGQLKAIRELLPTLDPGRFSSLWTDLLVEAGANHACV